MNNSKRNVLVFLIGTMFMGSLLGFLELSTLIEKMLDIRIIGLTDLSAARLYYPVLTTISSFGFYGLYYFKSWSLSKRILALLVLLVMVILNTILIVNFGETLRLSAIFQSITRGVMVIIFLLTLLSIGKDLAGRRKHI